MVIRVVIIDSHKIVRAALATFIDLFDEFELAGVAEDGAAGLALCLEQQPHVVITEINLPHLDGITLTQHLTQKPSSIKVIALDINQLPEKIEAGLQAGASVYLTKETNIEELAQAIRDVAQGKHLPPVVQVSK